MAYILAGERHGAVVVVNVVVVVVEGELRFGYLVYLFFFFFAGPPGARAVRRTAGTLCAARGAGAGALIACRAAARLPWRMIRRRGQAALGGRRDCRGERVPAQPADAAGCVLALRACCSAGGAGGVDRGLLPVPRPLGHLGLLRILQTLHIHGLPLLLLLLLLLVVRGLELEGIRAFGWRARAAESATPPGPTAAAAATRTPRRRGWHSALEGRQVQCQGSGPRSEFAGLRTRPQTAKKNSSG